MKAIEDMTEIELRDLTNALFAIARDALPPRTCFAVLFWPPGKPGVGHYVTTSGREALINELRLTANVIEQGQDVRL
jgi:hypothetical protein